MKKIIVCVSLLITLAAACQQKEEPRPQSQFPTGPVVSQAELKMLQDVVSKDPNNLEAWIKLGNVLMDSARFTEAIDAYSKALALDPKNVDVRVDMGTCYRNSGKPDLAVKEYRKALEINPNHLMAHKNLGVVLAYDLNDKAQAIKEFEKYLELAPYGPDAEQTRREIEKLKK